MKWKRVLAFAMSAALLVSAPFTNASLVYADEAAEQGASVEGVEPEGEEPAETWSGIVDLSTTSQAEQIKEEKIWTPSDSVQAQSTGVKISDEMLPSNNGTEESEPEEDEDEKSGKVTLQEAENNAAASELLRNGEKKDSIRELLSEGNISETDQVPVIIVLEGDSVIEGDSEAEMNFVTRARSRSLETKQESVISEIEDSVLDGEDLDIRYHYTWLLNGVATEVPYGTIDEIEEVEGVKEVILQTVYNVAENTETPYTVSDGEMIGREETWADGYTGKGIRISIIDTGIDDDHQNFAALSDSELTDDSATRETVSRVLSSLNANSLYQDLTVDDVYRSTKIAFGFNYVDRTLRINHTGDSAGEHGTHVAGIAAANDLHNGEAVGVAPDAQLYVMKVFGENGGAYTEDILAALEDSLKLGADVINMSLGSPAGFTSDGELLDEVYGRVSDTNTILAVAAGNSASVGQGNMWGTDTNLTGNPDNSTVSSPATYVNATSVASVDNAKVKGFYLEVNGTKIGYDEGSNGENASMVDELGGEEYEYVIVPNLGQELSDFTDMDVTGKVAVVSRGVTTFVSKVELAEAAGAVACLIYNNTSGTIGMDLTGSSSTIPCASITMQAGEFLAAALEEDPECKMGFSSEQALIPSETAYRMSSFSSWGISPNLSLEPDITAPGGNIYSTLDGGNYGLMSGTSMATPNVAGISALVMQYAKAQYPEMSASELHTFVNSMLMSTAVPLVYDETTMFSPRSQGAGLANAYNAVTSRAYLTVDGMDVPKVELLDDPAKTGAYAFDFRVHNFGDTDAYYKLSTNTQTEDVLQDEELGKSFMAMTPIALDAEAEETSDSLIYTYDYNENGKTNSSDARSLYLRVIRNEMAEAGEFFRYDLDDSEDSTLDDVQTYLDALVGKSDVDLNDQVLKVSKGKEASVAVKIQITDAGKTYMDTNFENGIYVEGFTVLEAKNAGGVDLSIPYMGFYGDWTKAPIIDSGFYWQDYEDIEASQYLNIIFTNYGNGDWYPGINPYLDEEFDESHISISPNEDGYGDYFTEIYLSLLRNARTLQFAYTDAVTGTEYYETTLHNVEKSYYNETYGQIIPFVYTWYDEEGYDFTDEEGNYLENNTKVDFSIRAELDYDVHEQNNVSAVWELPVTVDTEAPVVEEDYDIYVRDGKRYLELTFHDNVAVAAMNFLNKSNTMILAQYPVNKTAAGESCTMEFDITGFGNQFNLVVGDYAFNESTYVIRTEDNDPEIDENLLYGYRVYDDDYHDDTVYGWIGIDPENADTSVFDSEYYVDYALTAAEYIGGYIVAVDADHALLFIKPGYWDERTEIAKLDVNIKDMAFDPTEQKLYAYDSTNSKLCTIDLETGAVTDITATFLTGVLGMACADDGTLYGMDNFGVLKTLNKETGVWGDVVYDTYGDTGFIPSNAQSMTYDSEENAIYWAAFSYSWFYGSTGALYRYDLDDDTFDEIGTIAGNAEVVGLLKMDDRGYELPETDITSIGLEQTSITMLTGGKKILNLTRTPWYGTEQQFIWRSSDEAVAEVSENGEVTGIGVGTADITVSNADGSLRATCKVFVVNPQSKLNGFAVSGNTLQNQWVSFTADHVKNATVLTDADFRDFLAGEYLDGYIYAYSSSTELYRIDADTFEAEKISDGDSDYIMQDMAYDYSSGFMYGIALDVRSSETTLVAIDTMTGEFTTVGSIEDEYRNPACGLAISTDGTIYVLTYTGMLYTYDTDEHELNKIGYTGYSVSTYTQCMAYDHNTQELYWAMISGSGEWGIMYMDTRTGAALSLGTFDGGAQITSMYSVPETVPERDPVEAESLELTLEGTTLRMLEGSKQTAPVRVLPLNATDRTVEWTVSNGEIASVENGMITAKKAGSTTVTGTKEIKGSTVTVTFTLEVLESTGEIYGYIQADLSTGIGQFWGRFLDNNLAEGEGLADASAYELYAGTWYNGKIYGYGMDADTFEYQYMVIDGNRYTLDTAVKGDFPNMLDMAFDYTEGAMYAVGGVKNVGSNSTLYTVDIKTGDAYKVADLTKRVMTLACTAEGQLYGVDTDGILYQVNKTTGELNRVGDTGYGANLYQSMTYDYNTGNIYWAQICSDAMSWQTTAYLLLVDPTDASVLNLGMVGLAGSQISALYTLPEEDIEVGTPAITKILMGSESEMLKPGEQVQLSATAYPLSVSLAEVQFTYASSDTDVATVDGNGLVTAVSAGTADITVSTGAVTATCTIQVVGKDTIVYAVNTNGWETSPLLWPDEISGTVELPEDKDLTIVTATYNEADGYFYAIGADGYLWKYTEDLGTVEKIGSDTVIRQLDIYSEFVEIDYSGMDEWTASYYKEWMEPKIIDVAANPFDQSVYALVQGLVEDDGGEMITFYICELDLTDGSSTATVEVPMDIDRPDEFVFTGEKEILIYDAYRDYIYSMSLEDHEGDSVKQVAWAQSVVASGDSNAMAYSRKLNRVFIATADYDYNNGMALFVLNPATGEIYKYADAVYDETMVDLILIEDSEPATTALEEDELEPAAEEEQIEPVAEEEQEQMEPVTEEEQEQMEPVTEEEESEPATEEDEPETELAEEIFSDLPKYFDMSE